MPRHTTANLRDRDKELTVQQHDTDSPVIPIAQIAKLHQIRPDLVDWVFTQTQTEAEHRREEVRRVNGFVFVERIVGQVFALLIGLAGIIGGVYAATNGQPWAGGTIASLAITGLAAVFLTGKKGKP